MDTPEWERIDWDRINPSVEVCRRATLSARAALEELESLVEDANPPTLDKKLVALARVQAAQEEAKSAFDAMMAEAIAECGRVGVDLEVLLAGIRTAAAEVEESERLGVDFLTEYDRWKDSEEDAE